jgi:hypothetical protein
MQARYSKVSLVTTCKDPWVLSIQAHPDDIKVYISGRKNLPIYIKK